MTLTAETVSLTREGQPDKLRRKLAGDLDNIILMAMRKEPQRRYTSVAEFSEDLGRYLDGLPVRARGRPLVDPFSEKIDELVDRSRARVRADVVHGVLVAMGYVGSYRTTRRASTGCRTQFR